MGWGFCAKVSADFKFRSYPFRGRVSVPILVDLFNIILPHSWSEWNPIKGIMQECHVALMFCIQGLSRLFSWHCFVKMDALSDMQNCLYWCVWENVGKMHSMAFLSWGDKIDQHSTCALSLSSHLTNSNPTRWLLLGWVDPVRSVLFQNWEDNEVKVLAPWKIDAQETNNVNWRDRILWETGRNLAKPLVISNYLLKPTKKIDEVQETGMRLALLLWISDYLLTLNSVVVLSF